MSIQLLSPLIKYHFDCFHFFPLQLAPLVSMFTIQLTLQILSGPRSLPSIDKKDFTALLSSPSPNDDKRFAAPAFHADTLTDIIFVHTNALMS